MKPIFKSGIRITFCTGILALIVAGGMLAGCKKQPLLDKVSQTPYLGLPQGQVHLFSIDLRRLRDRDFFKEALTSIRQQQGYEETYSNLVRNMGSDPIYDIDTIIISDRGTTTPGDLPLKNGVVIALGNFSNPEQKMQGLYQWLREEILIAPQPFTESMHDGTEFKKFTLQAPSQYNETMTLSVNFAFPTERVMIFSLSPTLFNETLEVIAGRAPGMLEDKAWLDLVNKVPNRGAILWGTGHADASAMQTVSQTAPGLEISSVQQYYFTINFGEGFTGEIGLICSSIDTVNQVTEGIKQGLAFMSEMLKQQAVLLPETVKIPNKITVLPDGQIAKILLTLNEQEATALRMEWRRFEEMQRAAQNQ